MAKAPAAAPAASKYESKDDAADTGTPGSPEGAGTAYTNENSATENSNGKASATVAGGDPVTSPVIGNPGEARPDMGYDYALAAAPAASAPLASPEVLAAAATPDPKDQLINQLLAELAAAKAGTVAAPAAAPAAKAVVKHPRLVKARMKGHYNGLREAGDIFENEQNLAPYPEDPNSWFESAE